VVTAGAIRCAKLWTVKLSPPTNRKTSFYRPNALTFTPSAMSEH